MPIWQLCANLLIPNCLRSNLSYSPLAALEPYVNVLKSLTLFSKKIDCLSWSGWLNSLNAAIEPLSPAFSWFWKKNSSYSHFFPPFSWNVTIKLLSLYLRKLHLGKTIKRGWQVECSVEEWQVDTVEGFLQRRAHWLSSEDYVGKTGARDEERRWGYLLRLTALANYRYKCEWT